MEDKTPVENEGIQDPEKGVDQTPPQDEVKNLSTEEMAEKIRKQEANKFRRTIALLEEKHKSQEELIKKLNAQLQEESEKARRALNTQAGETELQKSFQQQNLPNTNNAVVEELAQERQKREAFERRIRELENTIIISDLNAQYNGRLIPEMITGDTPEELRESAKRSHERYLQIEEAALTRVKNQLAATSADPVTPADTETTIAQQAPRPLNPTGNPGNSNPIAATLATITSLSPTQRVKFMQGLSPEERDALRRQVEADFLSR